MREASFLSSFSPLPLLTFYPILIMGYHVLHQFDEKWLDGPERYGVGDVERFLDRALIEHYEPPQPSIFARLRRKGMLLIITTALMFAAFALLFHLLSSHNLPFSLS